MKLELHQHGYQVHNKAKLHKGRKVTHWYLNNNQNLYRAKRARNLKTVLRREERIATQEQ